MCSRHQPENGADSIEALANIEHGGGHGVGGELRTMVLPSDLSSVEFLVHDETPAASRTSNLDIFDALADYLVASAFIDALTCDACELPATDGGFCRGHARLFRYTDHERSGGIAANE